MVLLAAIGSSNVTNTPMPKTAINTTIKSGLRFTIAYSLVTALYRSAPDGTLACPLLLLASGKTSANFRDYFTKKINVYPSSQKTRVSGPFRPFSWR
jgi:hypothetical protein